MAHGFEHLIIVLYRSWDEDGWMRRLRRHVCRRRTGCFGCWRVGLFYEWVIKLGLWAGLSFDGVGRVQFIGGCLAKVTRDQTQARACNGRSAS